jgi:hypothetical protein
MSYDEALMREVTIPFARRSDGSGVCFLSMRKGSAEYFGFDKLPTPKDYGRFDPSGQFREITVASKKGGANNLSLRIAYEWPAGAKKPHMTRLRISGDPCLDSVQVLTDHLNETGVKWLWFCKAHGGMLSSSCFRSTV